MRPSRSPIKPQRSSAVPIRQQMGASPQRQTDQRRDGPPPPSAANSSRMAAQFAGLEAVRSSPLLQSRGASVAQLQDSPGVLARRGQLDAMTGPLQLVSGKQAQSSAAAPPQTTQVGVQLVLDSSGLIDHVLVAGRPESPFAGTMGDHVTAFGVHVVNLRHAMRGKACQAAYDGLVELAGAMEKLPGWALAKDDSDGPWQLRRTQFDQARKEWDGEASLDRRVAHLQWLAALYLEVREGVPLSLLNTRSITASGGRGRGEAQHLPELMKYHQAPGKMGSVKVRKIALGLFDEDAAAMLTFHRESEQWQSMQGLLPDHTDSTTMKGWTRDRLVRRLANQHVDSLFPNMDGKQAKSIKKAVASKLLIAHETRKEQDFSHWVAKIDGNRSKIVLATQNALLKSWLTQYFNPAISDVHALFRNTLLLLSSRGVVRPKETAFVADLGALDQKQEALLFPAWKLANWADLADAEPLMQAMQAFFSALTVDASWKEFWDAISEMKTIDDLPSLPDRSDLEQLQKALNELESAFFELEGRVVELEAAKEERKRERKAAQEKKRQARKGLTTSPAVASPGVGGDADVLMAEQGGTGLTLSSDGVGAASDQLSNGSHKRKRAAEEDGTGGADEASSSEESRLSFADIVKKRKGNRSAPSAFETAAASNAEAIMAELSSSTGNSFTVSVRLGPDGKIAHASLRGRPPSPFKATMGAHATAWVVWANAVANQLLGASVDEAGARLATFAETLLAKIARDGLVGRAQNPSRREAARWSADSFDAWIGILARCAGVEAWTVPLVQAFAQAILTCANQLPGTTRAGKNTDGHGEAEAWKRARELYADPDTREHALLGQGLFDSKGDQTQHRWLMARALNRPGAEPGLDGQNDDEDNAVGAL